MCTDPKLTLKNVVKLGLTLDVFLEFSLSIQSMDFYFNY